ncbi:hypothetical protein Pmani_025885 [Petrolisthes manimaculis]|uniref:Uncharacterized protein n=1 Tax=Petrolisthes manimaculis TaxID=1843537 RepID=A0AAE1U0P5_9EUCA|nr:hypothetical protein Pmani_025885 [Petrolisthes manimaculis]
MQSRGRRKRGGGTEAGQGKGGESPDSYVSTHRDNLRLITLVSGDNMFWARWAQSTSLVFRERPSSRVRRTLVNFAKHLHQSQSSVLDPLCCPLV